MSSMRTINRAFAKAENSAFWRVLFLLSLFLAIECNIIALRVHKHDLSITLLNLKPNVARALNGGATSCKAD